MSQQVTHWIVVFVEYPWQWGSVYDPTCGRMVDAGIGMLVVRRMGSAFSEPSCVMHMFFPRNSKWRVGSDFSRQHDRIIRKRY